MVERVRERLQRARAEIDQLAARPLAERDMDALRQAIESMFDVVDLLQPAIAWQVRELSACHEGLAAAALTGNMLGDLREYGGRIASQIMAPVAARRPMPVQSLVDATRSRGRLPELWQLAGPAYNMFGNSPALDHAYADTNHQFFGQGMAMIDSLVAQGRVSGHYSMTPEELTNRYVRTLVPPDSVLARFGGEEFALLLPHGRPGQAATQAETLRAALAGGPVRLPGGKSPQVTASFGVAIGHGGAHHWQRLFAAADAAMYRAKAEGRNCVREAQGEEGVPVA